MAEIFVLLVKILFLCTQFILNIHFNHLKRYKYVRN